MGYRSHGQVLLDMERGSKVCTACGVDKPLDEYYANRRGDKRATDGLTTQCKPCVITVQMRYKATAAGQAANRRRATNHTRLKNYGLTPEAYASMHAGQLGLCAICGEPETKITKTGITQSLSVDHDHLTGVVRGLLCDRCNGLLGRVKDNPEILEAAIRYLRSATDSGRKDH